MTETDAPRERELHASEIAKFEAEALAARALADKHMAEAHKFATEARVSEIEAEVDTLRMVTVRHESDRAEEKRREELAAHKYHHVYFFKGAVSDDSAEKCMTQLTSWMRNEPKCAIEIIFNSPGGSVTAGLALWDHIQFVRAAGHKVTTSTIGMAASMAGILLQAGDTRVMGRESWLLIHQASFGTQGSFGEVEDTVKWIERIQERILDIFASRSTLTKAQIKRRWTRTDWWVSSDEALRLGLVDQLR